MIRSINGISAYDPVTRTQNSDFFRILDAFKDLQDEEALGIRRETKGEETRTYLYLRDVEANSTIEQALEVLVQKLKLIVTNCCR